MTVLDDSLVDKVIDDRFRVTAYLGRGGMGAAFRAEQMDLRRSVCIKFLCLEALTDTENLARFKREAKVLARLQHKNIAACFAFGVLEQTYPYLAMEYVDGLSLRKLAQGEPMAWQRACRLIIQVCDALDYAHKHDFVHRDVKPDNIMVCNVGTEEVVKVIDFGLAGKEKGSQSELDTLTDPRDIIGSVNYMAPESFAGSSSTRAIDVYALCCTLFELLSGQVPFEAENMAAIAYKHSSQRLPSLPASVAPNPIRRRLESIIWKGTAVRVQDRFQSCDMVAELLEGLLREEFETGALPFPALESRVKNNWPGSLGSKIIASLTVVFAMVCVWALYSQTVSEKALVQSDRKASETTEDLMAAERELEALNRQWATVDQLSLTQLLNKTNSQLEAMEASVFKTNSDSADSAMIRKLVNTLSRLGSAMAGKGTNRDRRIADLQCDLLTRFHCYEEALVVLNSSKPVTLGEKHVCRGATEFEKFHDLVAKQVAEQAGDAKRFLARLRPAVMEYAKVRDDGFKFEWLMGQCRRHRLKDGFLQSLPQVATQVRTNSRARTAQIMVSLAELEIAFDKQADALLLLEKARALCATCIAPPTEDLCRVLILAGKEREACSILESTVPNSDFEYCKLKIYLAETVIKKDRIRGKSLLDAAVKSTQFRRLVSDPAANVDHLCDVLR